MSWESDRQATAAHRANLMAAKVRRCSKSATTREGWEDESMNLAIAGNYGLYSLVMPSQKMYGKEATQ